MAAIKSESRLFHFIGSLFISLTYLLIYPMYRAAITAGPNSTLGYRTARSRASEAAWEFANALAADYSIWVAIILTILVLVVSAILYFLKVKNISAWRALTYGTFGLWMVGTIIVIVLVEHALAIL